MIPIRIRWSAFLALGLTVVLAGTAAAASWSSPTKVGPKYGFGLGSQLALSSASGVSYLQAQFTNDFINGRFASDDGPYMGVFHARRSTASSTWSAPLRLSANGTHASRGAIAAAGRNVYAAWVTQTSYEDYRPGAERMLVFRHNTSHGGSGAWGARMALGLDGDRVDFPSIAATTNRVLITHTDADTGDIKLLRGAHASGDHIQGFAGQNVGTTSMAAGADGFTGLPAVAATGQHVMVVWIDDAKGKLVARYSDDGGIEFDPEAAVGANAVDAPQAFARGDRIAVTWPTANSIRLRIFTPATGWGDVRTVATFQDTGTFKSGYGATVALIGTDRVGVAWSECRRTSCTGINGPSAKGVDVAWRESSDNGATWAAKVSLTDSTLGGKAGKRRRINDYPSAVYRSGTTRYVLYNTSSSNFSTSQLYLRSGTGPP